MAQENALQVMEPGRQILNVGGGSNASVFFNIQTFQDGQRMATMLAQSKMIPDLYKNNIVDCMIAMELANRIGASFMAVMQNTYEVHGKIGYSASFVISAINTCGRFSPLRYEITGELMEMTCLAWAYDKSTKDRLEGPPVSMKMAKDEGWIDKKGSKWKSMPKAMIMYRAATFFGRLYAPELLHGMRTIDEIVDIGENENGISEKIELADINEKFKEKRKQTVIFDVLQDAMPAAAEEQKVDPVAKEMMPETKSEKSPNQHSSVKVESAPDETLSTTSKILGDEKILTDSKVPGVGLQIALRKSKTAMGLDKWRNANYQTIKNQLGEDDADLFIEWTQVVYEIWKEQEAANSQLKMEI